MALLEGQVAIITGAGTGIGAATAIRFVAEHALVVLVGRRREKLEETAARIINVIGHILVADGGLTCSL